MSPLAIALQGIGFGVQLVAAQGFAPDPIAPIPGAMAPLGGARTRRSAGKRRVLTFIEAPLQDEEVAAQTHAALGTAIAVTCPVSGSAAAPTLKKRTRRVRDTEHLLLLH